MSATFTPESDSREPSSRPAREVPVLFHLMDVSRARGKSARPKADDPHQGVEAPAGTKVEPKEEPSQCQAPNTLGCEPGPGAASAADCTAGTAIHSECNEPAATQPAADPALPTPTVTSAEAEPAANDSSAEATSTSQSGEATAATDASDATKATVSAHDRAEQRRRQRQTATQPNWFSTQGKYIAIGFVVALVGTVCVARIGRKPAKPAGAVAPHAHPGAAARADDKPAAAELVIEMPAKAGQAAESPAKAVAADGTPAEPKEAKGADVELHTPQLNVPQLTESQPAEKPSDAGLFPWPQRPDVRVAAQPTENHTLRPQTGAAPQSPAPTTMPPAGPTPAGPALELAQPTGAPGSTYGAAPAYGSAPAYQPAPANAPPTYGTTPAPAYGAAPGPAYGSPGPAYSSTPAAATAPVDQPLYPSTNYRSQFQPVASDPAGIGPVGPTGAPLTGSAPAPSTGGPYYPTTNSASGYRHERTGSGLY